MILFPPCKINLGLQVLRKRTDGYHDLCTVFYPAGWCDALEVIVGGKAPFEITLSGLPVPGNVENNLCYKAWQLLAADYKLPPLKAHLHKVVPMGAGLGGGSSDGAVMLKLINEVCKLNLSKEQLFGYASQLGSDCPFFIEAKPVIATGRGEVLEPVNLDLSSYYLFIIMPELTVGTAEAYSWVKAKESEVDLKDIIRLPIEQWQGKLVNDFQQPVGQRHQVIKELI